MTMTQEPTVSSDAELITFYIQDQAFCVDIMTVREIRGWTPATALPNAPRYMRGVINLRGVVLPIMDLAARLGLPPCEPKARSVIIVVGVGSKLLGLLVDAVSDIVTVNRSQIQPAPDFSGDPMQSYVLGLVNVDERLIAVIGTDRLTTGDDVEALAA